MGPKGARAQGCECQEGEAKVGHEMEFRNEGSLKVGRYEVELLVKTDPRKAFVHMHFPKGRIEEVHRERAVGHPHGIDAVGQDLVGRAIVTLAPKVHRVVHMGFARCQCPHRVHLPARRRFVASVSDLKRVGSGVGQVVIEIGGAFT